MSPQLKYRAWSIAESRMLTASELADLLVFSYGYGVQLRIEVSSISHRMRLMQYTDLYDKHGIEICDGDVLSYVDSSASRSGLAKKITIVVQRATYGTWTPFNDLLHPLPERCEVIGNIHQHPELAKFATGVRLAPL